ncbi:acyl--CoA ligase [Brachybacterium sp. EF45031]|uniref:class I adenylate-forming enzyme family protein n=1 Tax=Brachybacterium sillae TaxID=2810536 RepID=UPI00217DDF50|nr:class I adenylate-forming enzyme family protein [Brachybacterium sillae]MCS6712566.1 acyl--CoA ligase [Brachybacterium sillae]
MPLVPRPAALRRAVRAGASGATRMVRVLRPPSSALDMSVARAARGLWNLGIRPGHRVAVIAPARPETTVAVGAIWRIGAVAVLLDPTSTARELRRVVEDHAPSAAVVDPRSRAALLALPPDLAPKAAILLPPRVTVRLAQAVSRGTPPIEDPAEDRLIPWSRVVGSVPLDPHHPLPGPRDLAVLQYEPGPGGAVFASKLTHENLYAWAQALEDLIDAPGADVISLLPLQEATGLLTQLALPLLRGHRCLAPRRVDRAAALLQRASGGVLCATAGQLTALDALLPPDRRAVHRVVLLGADEPAAEVLTAWQRRSDRPVTRALVRAESGVTLTAVLEPAADPLAATPTPAPTGPTRWRVPHGCSLQVDEDGWLSIHGAQVFHGYWQRPDETALMLSGDGWARTGDRVHRLAGDDALDLIRPRYTAVTGDGEVLSPREVAHVLAAHPDVVDAQVEVRGSPDGGSCLAASVTVREGSGLSLAEVERHLARRLSPSKRPRHLTLR